MALFTVPCATAMSLLLCLKKLIVLTFPKNEPLSLPTTISPTVMLASFSVIFKPRRSSPPKHEVVVSFKVLYLKERTRGEITLPYPYNIRKNTLRKTTCCKLKIRAF